MGAASRQAKTGLPPVPPHAHVKAATRHGECGAMDWWFDKTIAIITAAAALITVWLSYRAYKMQNQRTPPLLVVSAAESPLNPGWIRLFAYLQDSGSHPFRINYIRVRKPRNARMLNETDAFVRPLSVNNRREMKNPLPRDEATQKLKAPAFSAEGGVKLQFVAYVSLDPRSPRAEILEIEFNLSWRDRMSRAFALMHDVRVTMTPRRQSD